MKLVKVNPVTEPELPKKKSEEKSDELKSPTEDKDIEIPEELRAISQKINVEEFEILKVLGRGTYGKVMLVRHITTRKLFALKSLKKSRVIKLLQVEHTKSERK